MNERQRILMQKIAEYGDFKYRKGLMFKHVTATSEPKRYVELGDKAEALFTEITQMVTEWVGESDGDALPDSVDAHSRQVSG